MASLFQNSENAASYEPLMGRSLPRVTLERPRANHEWSGEVTKKKSGMELLKSACIVAPIFVLLIFPLAFLGVPAWTNSASLQRLLERTLSRSSGWRSLRVLQSPATAATTSPGTATSVTSGLGSQHSLGTADAVLAATPPRGWNSYNSFSWIITEEEFMQNAEMVAKLLRPHGFEYVVLDFLWYRSLAPDITEQSLGADLFDLWGIPLPDPSRWPSTAPSAGFRPIADRLHAMGLKFGLHLMRGISTGAVQQRTAIWHAQGSPEGTGGRPWDAADVAVEGLACGWMPTWWGLNTSLPAAAAYFDSLYARLAEWGVDFVKHDCVFGGDLLQAELEAAAAAIEKSGRTMVISLSPGALVTPSMATPLLPYASMYRITGDFWDYWEAILQHFDAARDFAAAGLIGTQGFAGGRSWPDLDMLVLGRLTTPGTKLGPYRDCQLSHDEQRTLVTLWGMAKSPLMFGGDMRALQGDEWTLSLLTEVELLEINSRSHGNHEVTRQRRDGDGGEQMLQLEESVLGEGGQGEGQANRRVMEEKGGGVLKQASGGHAEAEEFEVQVGNCSPKDSLWRAENDCVVLGGEGGGTEEKVACPRDGKLVVWKRELGPDNIPLFVRRCLHAAASLGSTPHSLDKFLAPCSAAVSEQQQQWELMPADGNMVVVRSAVDKQLFCRSRRVHAQLHADGAIFGTRIWAAMIDADRLYVAVFNVLERIQKVLLPFETILESMEQRLEMESRNDVGLKQWQDRTAMLQGARQWYRALFDTARHGFKCDLWDVWSKTQVASEGGFMIHIPRHGVALLRLQCG